MRYGIWMRDSWEERTGDRGSATLTGTPDVDAAGTAGPRYLPLAHVRGSATLGFRLPEPRPLGSGWLSPHPRPRSAAGGGRTGGEDRGPPR